MRHYLYVGFLFLLSLNTVVFDVKAQSRINNFELNGAIKSKQLNETREFTIHLPASYHNSKQRQYPVLYVLDGQNLQKNTVFIADFLSSKRHIPQVIIVSIPHTGQRSRDYNTFKRDSDEINKGADNFLGFIQHELIPHVQSHYRTTNYRMLSGHSNSGLFVIHSLLKKPDLFNARFAFSPSLHHLPKLKGLLAGVFKQQKNINGYFYANVGGTEFFKIKDAFADTEALFEQHAPKHLRYDFELHEVDGHQSSPFIGQHMAFKRLFAPLRLGHDYERLSYQDVVAHFDEVSREFGYTVKPKVKELTSMAGYYVNIVPNHAVLINLNKLMDHYYPKKPQNGDMVFFENWLAQGIHPVERYFKGPKPDEDTLNSMGYGYLDKKQFAEALYLLELATRLYPNSSNTFDSYGEALERSGDLINALKMYKKAFAIEQNAAKPNAGKMQFYRKNIARMEHNLG